jgi:DNA helicase-2/ATP-dependent DNA helicase PcrA
MSGGESLWRANWTENSDPFAHLAAANATRAGQRGPGWKRASASGSFSTKPQKIKEARRSAVSMGNKGRDDIAIGQRIFHTKFGYGEVMEIEFEKSGSKRVLDSFVEIA